MLTRLLAALLAATICSPLSADIIVEVQNATVSTGGTGFVDVLIRSDGTLTDLIASASYQFQISAPTLNGALRFRALQSNSETTAPNYIFLGDSINFNAVRQDPDEQTLVGGDGASGNVNIAGGPFLLARLELEHITGTPLAAIGDTFTISLIPSLNTDFLDENLVSLTQGLHTSGTITITSAAVPEPASGTLLLSVAALGLLSRRKARSLSQCKIASLPTA